MPPMFNSSDMLSSASDKAKLYATNFSKNVFPPETVKYLGSVQWGQSYLMWRRCLFSLGGHPSSDDFTIKMPMVAGGSCD